MDGILHSLLGFIKYKIDPASVVITDSIQLVCVGDVKDCQKWKIPGDDRRIFSMCDHTASGSTFCVTFHGLCEIIVELSRSLLDHRHVTNPVTGMLEVQYLTTGTLKISDEMFKLQVQLIGIFNLFSDSKDGAQLVCTVCEDEFLPDKNRDKNIIDDLKQFKLIVNISKYS